MCGRYVRRSDKQKIAEWFHAEADLASLPMPDADYNIAPTTSQPIVRQSRETGEREMVLARWGLVPFFTKDIGDAKGLSTINARAETIATAKTWREPFKKRRCLIRANLFAFAGVWDAWKDGQGHWLQSFAIVTTEANEMMSRIHSRMPVILHPRDYDRWLDRTETEQLPVDLLRPFDSDAMEMREANPKVNNARNNGPEMLERALLAAESGQLPL
jgi:putative SOS response-associated peptidase YedK